MNTGPGHWSGPVRFSTSPAYRSRVEAPAHIDLKKDQALTVTWHDGTVSYFTIAYLRRMSPSADMRELREKIKKNPLTVLPTRPGGGASAPLVVTHAEIVGNYALAIHFSDGHTTGIYTWEYLREIDRGDKPPQPVTPEKGA